MAGVVFLSADTKLEIEIEDAGGSEILVASPDKMSDLPDDTRAVVACNGTHATDEAEGKLIGAALEEELPILAMGSSMHVLNQQLFGKSGNRRFENGENMSVFIAPGSKFASLVGGSGWLKMPLRDTPAIGFHELTHDAMPACIGSDKSTYAFELPGKRWVIGLYWNVLSDQKLPKGFSNVVNKFLTNSKQQQG